MLSSEAGKPVRSLTAGEYPGMCSLQHGEKRKWSLNVVKPSVYLYLLCFSPLKTVQVKKNNLYILEYKLIPALLGFSNIKIFFRLKNVMGKISIFSQINNRVEQLCNLSLAKSSNS